MVCREILSLESCLRFKTSIFFAGIILKYAVSSFIVPLNSEILPGTKLSVSKTSVSDCTANFLDRSFSSCPKEQKVRREKRTMRSGDRTTDYNENKGTKLFVERAF